MKRFLKYLLPFVLSGSLANASAIIQDASVTRAKLAVGGVAKLKVTAASTTYTVLTSDDVVNLSGASFTVTLFTAVGNTGRVLTLIHSGTSLSQIYTVNTTGGQTFCGYASGVAKLNTNTEAWRVVSDGSSWVCLNHYSNTSPTAFTPTVSAGYGAITNNTNKSFWYRQGNWIYIYGTFTTGTVAATVNSHTTLTGANIDTTIFPLAQIIPGYGLSMSAANNNIAAGNFLTFPFYDGSSATTIFFAFTTNANALVKSNVSSVAQSSQIYHYTYSYPVSGWQP